MPASATSITCTCGAKIPLVVERDSALTVTCPSCGLPLQITPLKPSRRRRRADRSLFREPGSPRDVEKVRKSRGRGHSLLARDHKLTENHPLFTARRRHHRSTTRLRTKFVYGSSGLLMVLGLVTLILAVNVDERHYPFGVTVLMMAIASFVSIGMGVTLLLYFAQDP